MHNSRDIHRLVPPGSDFKLKLVHFPIAPGGASFDENFPLQILGLV
jgi:hypothetical protein